MKVAGDGARASECGVWICGASADTARDGTGRAQSTGVTRGGRLLVRNTQVAEGRRCLR